MDAIEKNLLSKVADLHEVPEGAYNIRANGESIGRNTTANIDIVTKEDVSGIDIIVRSGTKNESIHIPVVLSKAGIEETVYNDFIIGDDCDITIIAGCGIHNCGNQKSEHSGIHSFHIGKNSKVVYVEKHYGAGDGSGERVMNPTTVIEIDEGGFMKMDTTQIKGIDSTIRVTNAKLKKDAKLVVNEKLMTHGSQYAETEFNVEMDGENSSANVVSRSVARDKSVQKFTSVIKGNNKCVGHTECDAIIMDDASVSAIPKISANCVDASLIHEAAIGKIAGDQLVKLMTLGLSEKEAEEQIVNGFLK